MISSVKNLLISNSVTGYNPDNDRLTHAFQLTESAINHQLNITLVFVGTDEIFILNNQLRNKSNPTDVISLPFDQYDGEVYICPEYITQQGYDDTRILHLWVHGLLHIAGYTHDDDATFEKMSSLESQILKQLNIADPYHESH